MSESQTETEPSQPEKEEPARKSKRSRSSKKRKGNWILSLLVTGLTLSLFGVAAVVGVIYYYSQDLPDYKQLAEYSPDTVTRLYAGDGRLLEEYATEKRAFVPIESIPKRIIYAFLSAEDRNFYQHPGIDFVGIGRAVVTNARNFMQHKQNLVGGSTITQQVIKNFLLTSEKKLARKIKEAILAFRVTKLFSKDHILELYLNDIYLGYGSYGIAAAALNYFNKPIEELTIEEAAFLATLPKAPAHYDPRKYYDRAKSRRDWVIGRMEEDGYIRKEEAEEAIKTPILLRQRDETEAVAAPYFAEEVRRNLIEDYGYDTLYKGGLSVRTTLNPDMQKMAEKALDDGLISYDRRHGYRGPVTSLPSIQNWQDKLRAVPSPPLHDNWKLAVVTAIQADRAYIGFSNGATGEIPLSELKWARKALKNNDRGPAIAQPGDVLTKGDVIIVAETEENKNNYSLQQVPKINGSLIALDPHTGRVLAMAGGLSFRKDEFNRATQAQRQPGSAFKPFIYLTALENGFTPSSIIDDAPVSIYQGPGLPLWKPKNYGNRFYGPSTLRVGLEKSRNVMTVRLAQELGLNAIREVAQRFGIYDNFPLNYSAVLGAYETTLMRLTSAYGTFVNGGRRITPYLIERIQDRNGHTIFRQDKRECLTCRLRDGDDLLMPTVPHLPDTREILLDPVTAYQMTSILHGVIEHGTGVRARKIGKPLGGKTGTTNDSYDTWFIGFSPNLVTGVFVGFDQPASLGKKETGSSVALPIWVDFMQAALKDEPSLPFRTPEGVRLIRVDRETGLPPTPGTPIKQMIFEAFRTGTEPGSQGWRVHHLMSPTSPIGLPEGEAYSPEAPSPSFTPSVGTGGLY